MKKHLFLACLSAVQLCHTFYFAPTAGLCVSDIHNEGSPHLDLARQIPNSKIVQKTSGKDLLTSPQGLAFSAAKQAKFYCYSIAHSRDFSNKQTNSFSELLEENFFKFSPPQNTIIHFTPLSYSDVVSFNI